MVGVQPHPEYGDLIGCFLPDRRDIVIRMDTRLDSAIADDFQPAGRRCRADVKINHRAGSIGVRPGVAPDLAARAVHARIFVIVTAHRLMPFLWESVRNRENLGIVRHFTPHSLSGNSDQNHNGLGSDKYIR